MTADADAPLRLGVSACLLGEPVRFDGGHKRNFFLVEALGRFVEWVPVCPELESGLGVPRESMRLVGTAGEIRLVTVRSARDHTDTVNRYALQRIEQIAEERLSGFVLKRDSPTCGLERVRVYHGSGVPTRNGRGLFAAALTERFPTLPVEEEGRLTDARLRENFIECIFAYRDLSHLFTGRWTMGDLVRFHTARKLTLLAHVPTAYQRLGRLVAAGKALARSVLRAEYSTGFMKALRTVPTPRRHRNVLQHMLGHFKNTLDQGDRDELLTLIHTYAAGQVPLVVPLSLFAHHIRRNDVSYLAGQNYLSPHPPELMLRNHV
jgi:uncharacterized protein YbgA (DUF1722 family)/uncharacterized protein YbbK (DUF523 family)